MGSRGALALQMRPIHGLTIPFCTNMMRRRAGWSRLLRWSVALSIHSKRIGRRQRQPTALSGLGRANVTPSIQSNLDAVFYTGAPA